MRNTLIIAFALLLVLIVGFAWYLFGRSDGTAGESAPRESDTTYNCDNGRFIDASFTDGEATFSLSDGRSFTLLKVPSASGAKYTNRDGSIILWTKGYSAFLEENDETTYTGCVISPLSFSGGA